MSTQILMYAPLSPDPPSGVSGPAGPPGPAGGAARLSSDWRDFTAAARRGTAPGASSCLAEPGPGRSAAEVAWRTALPGRVLPLAALSAEGRAAAEDAARARAGELAALGSRLASAPDPAAKAAARLVSRAAAQLAAAAGGAKGAGTLFAVGGIPVLAGWDLARHARDAPAGPSALRPGQDSRTPPDSPYSPAFTGTGIFQSPPPAPQAPVAQPGSLRAGTGVPPPFPAPPAAPISSRPESGGRAIRAGLSALAAFLLTLAASWQLGPGFGGAGADATAELSEDFAAGSPFGPGSSLSAELASLKALYKEKLMACSPGGGLPQPAGAPSDETPPSLPESGRVAPPPPPSAAAPRPLEAAAREPKEGDRIAIPEDPKDLAFLAGCWTTGEGHRTGDGSQAVNRVCFDGRGRGTVTIDLLGSNGRVVESCRGRASASIEGKRIKMRQFSARCPRRGNFSGGTIWCEPVPAGEAKCEAKNASERHGFPIPIYYRGPA